MTSGGNNMLDFNSIKTVEEESSLSVLDAMINLIDKNDLITEYAENDIMNDIIMESMMIFMETVSKEKDEITKWMDKEGYFYTGDNPKKKKETMRMYQFLKQNKFDPKTETYESDIKLKDGTKKRIKLNIGSRKMISDDDMKRYKTLKKKYEKGEYTDDEFDDYANLVNRINSANDVNRGKNAFFDSANKTINIGSKQLKGKQFVSSQLLKHEEGHAESNGDDEISHFRNANLSDDTPAGKALKEHKSAGKYVNKHDDSTEELMADKYAAENSKIRTSNRGKKHAKDFRGIKKLEVERWLKNLGSYLGENIGKEIADFKNDLQEKIDENNEYIKNIEDFDVSELNDLLHSESRDVNEIYDVIFNNIIVNRYFLPDDPVLKENINNYDMIRSSIISSFLEYKSKLRLFTEFYSLIIKDDQRCFDKKFEEVMEWSTRHGTAAIPDKIKELKETIHSYRQDIKTGNIKAYTDAKKIKNYLRHSDIRSAKKLIADMFTPTLNYYKRKNKEMIKMRDRAEECLKETRELRANFAKQYVKEYFSEITNRYYYNN